MENVINLAERKARKMPVLKYAPVPPPDTPRYYCTRCDTDQFKLYREHTIHCVNCGAMVANLSVTNSKLSA
jgi:hypothetical protein